MHGAEKCFDFFKYFLKIQDFLSLQTSAGVEEAQVFIFVFLVRELRRKVRRL